MDSDMIIYESAESHARDSEDTMRFDKSLSALEKAGIRVTRVMCTDESDVPEGEAADLIKESGMSALPVALYQGTLIASGSYPSDQDLADFLDVPDGVLSVNKTQGPAMANDIMPSCDCGNKNACSINKK